MNPNEYKILNLFRREDKPLFFREISKKSKVSIGGTQKVLANYSKFFDKEIKGRNTYYSIKKGITKFNYNKLIEVERTIRFLDKNNILMDFFEKLVEMEIPCLIFGSYASLTNNKESDLDLLILSEKKIPEHLCPNKLHIIRVNKKEFEKSLKLKENLFKEIRGNHVLIFDSDYFLEVFNKYEKD